MSNLGKRSASSGFVDLTNSDSEDEVPRAQPKQPRLNSTPGLSRAGSGSSRPSQAAGNSSSSQALNVRDQWGEGEEDEIIDLSQDVEEGFGWVLVGALDGKIVGVRFYEGYATAGEQVMIRREPGNPYDSNAIRINNVRGTQIGHLPRELAAKLAGFLDARTIVMEGVLTGEKRAYDCPVLLKIYGPADPAVRANLEKQLAAKRLPLKRREVAPPKPPKAPVLPPQRKQMGFTSSQASSSSQIEPTPQPVIDLAHFVANSERFNPREVDKMAEELGLPEDALSKMPMAEQPKDLKATLLPYQRQGLAWMLEKENPVLPDAKSDKVVQLWKASKEHKGTYKNIATNYCDKAPKLASGGILADDMGLGKTLQVISLILEGGTGTTLIVAPVSVMSNWAQQIERHIKEDKALKVLTYHGSQGKVKAMTPSDFKKYDVVITTYGTLSSELFPRGSKLPAKLPTTSGLFSFNWRRIVLDEGHIIRNPKTKSAIAATGISAISKWVLTGTPIVNTIKDFYSMLRFLGIGGGLNELEVFNAVFTRPLASRNRESELLLQTTMRALCLRRKKDMKFVDLRLPELSEFVHKVKFRNDELKIYEALVQQAKGMADQYQKQSESLMKNKIQYTHILEILLRMRQVCNHWKLCENRVNTLMDIIEKDDVVVLNAETRLALQMLLQLNIDNHEECSICLEELHNPVITTCKHVFGQECIERTIEIQHKCPMCRAHLENKEVLVHPAVETAEDEEINTDEQSSKTEALMQIIKVTHSDPLSKIVIFSQWTSFLNIVQKQLEQAGIKFARIDGSMTAPQRDKGIHSLESDPECRILLASLAVCSVGLNLVAADTVILADSWWAPAIEDQAVDRVHRLGQKRECKVWRLVMEGSIEERVLEIQAEKRKLVGRAFQEQAGKGRGKGKETRMGDILRLLR
ncbi:putative rad5-like protein [Botrytis fragariae]|uniref:Putative rad5-like protein n=1 Tax=Botrytis fragariae TaxID=1964551 RepID=A0A8H6ASJ3_9HELO|nr:putative rad5-like protein [Botrytis fragariae]KAF5872570.1 putative rad5-like protein [Botrytis fragariae]